MICNTVDLDSPSQDNDPVTGKLIFDNKAKFIADGIITHPHPILEMDSYIQTHIQDNELDSDYYMEVRVEKDINIDGTDTIFITDTMSKLFYTYINNQNGTSNGYVLICNPELEIVYKHQPTKGEVDNTQGGGAPKK
jgi:hypothetical protein